MTIELELDNIRETAFVRNPNNGHFIKTTDQSDMLAADDLVFAESVQAALDLLREREARVLPANLSQYCKNRSYGRDAVEYVGSDDPENNFYIYTGHDFEELKQYIKKYKIDCYNGGISHDFKQYIWGTLGYDFTYDKHCKYTIGFKKKRLYEPKVRPPRPDYIKVSEVECFCREYASMIIKDCKIMPNNPNSYRIYQSDYIMLAVNLINSGILKKRGDKSYKKLKTYVNLITRLKATRKETIKRWQKSTSYKNLLIILCRDANVKMPRHKVEVVL